MVLFKKALCFCLCFSLIIIGVFSNLPVQAEMIEKAPNAHQVDIQKLNLESQTGAEVNLAQMRAGDIPVEIEFILYVTVIALLGLALALAIT